ncbi:uncharacterized protein LACBIDRAFT_295643 [Laccaria bicolor S238N-H82]|uniref:Predicted protein n=1 Tax=Laccaria bicolor (strain S238N-H82 / ATCC MYA-4686) TaxID=486041 RepID=B0DWS6_LACBS|nr:uncharacterized protein LACBIDRAFT_295643 [Laccaria bicolor S238N-H82]EDR00946.1 predicted protein [Laccaria bicolor S238N-H82]|eukprot:XP_001888341.1 predicted protein [Laccaria bicolor S238N-H82]
MDQQDTFDITIVPPDNSSSVPIYFGTGHRVSPNGYYSPAGSSAGSSTPGTPYKPLLDLNAVNVNLQAGVNNPNFFELHQHHGFYSEGASPLSHSGLSPVTQSFGGLSLSDGNPSSVDHGARASSVSYEDSSQIFSEMPRGPIIHPPFESPCPSPGRQSLSPLIIPQQLQASQNASYVAGDPDDEFLRSIFIFGDERSPSSIDLRTPPSASHSEPSSLYTSWGSPSPSSTTDLPHPFVFDTAEHGAHSVPSIDGRLSQRRNTHSGGKSGFMDVPGSDRGRQDERAPPSPSSSRRSSPYPSHHHHTPGLSSSSLSPHSAIDSSHLSVPDREFFCGIPSPGDAVRRRHSFTHTGRPAETPFLHANEPNLSLSSTSAERPMRKVASQAGIKASEARRTKEARFACVLCNQTFTTNHNLKNHVNVHLGLKDHSCPRCRREFTTQSVMQRHLKTCKAPEF